MPAQAAGCWTAQTCGVRRPAHPPPAPTRHQRRARCPRIRSAGSGKPKMRRPHRASVPPPAPSRRLQVSPKAQERRLKPATPRRGPRHRRSWPAVRHTGATRLARLPPDKGSALEHPSARGMDQNPPRRPPRPVLALGVSSPGSMPGLTVGEVSVTRVGTRLVVTPLLVRVTHKHRLLERLRPLFSVKRQPQHHTGQTQHTVAEGLRISPLTVRCASTDLHLSPWSMITDHGDAQLMSCRPGSQARLCDSAAKTRWNRSGRSAV